MNVWGCTIEGLGGPQGLYRFVTHYTEAHFTFLGFSGLLPYLRQPGAFTHELRPRDGQTSLSVSDLLISNVTETRALLHTLQVPAAGTVTAVPSADTITLDTAGLDGEVIYWQREAIFLEGAPTSGPSGYTYDCQRGILGTQQASLGVGTDFFLSCPSLYNRVVTVFEFDGYEEHTRYTSLLNDIGFTDGHAEIRLFCSDIFAPAKRSTAWSRRWQGTVNSAQYVTREGERECTSILYTSNEGATGAPDYVRFEGSIFEATHTEALTGPAPRARSHGRFSPRTPYRGMTRRLSNDSLSFENVVGKAVDEVVVLPESAVESIMALLTSTAQGTNGPYDLGKDVGPGLNSDLFDLDAIAAFDSPLLVNQRLVLDEEDVTAWSHVQALLTTYGLFFRAVNGRYSLALWDDDYSEFDLDDVVLIPSQVAGLAEVVDTVTFRYSPAQVDRSERRRLIVDGVSTAGLHGRRDSLDVDAACLEDPQLAHVNAVSRLDRYEFPQPLYTFTTPEYLGIGTKGRVTSPWALTSTGGEGFTDAGALIVSETIDPIDGTNTYRARVTAGTFKRVGWSAKVLSYNAGTKTATVEHVNTDFVTAGFSLRIVTSAGVLKEAGHLVQAVTATTVTFTTAPTSVPVAGDWLTGLPVSSAGVEEDLTAYNEVDAWNR